jgi:hypothetical protein
MRGPRTRWLLYGAALVLTLIAIQWTGKFESQSASVAAPVARPVEREGVRPPLVSLAQGAGKSAEIDLERLRRPEHGRASTDPFSSQGWGGGKVAERAPAPVQPVVPPPPPAPAPEVPPFPHPYLGRLVEHGKSAVFFGVQDRVLVVRVGDVIDSLYRIEAIDERTITFNYLPLGIRQQLVLVQGAGAGDAARGSRAALNSRPVPAARNPGRRASEEDDD